MTYRSKVIFVYLLGFALDLLNMFVANIAYPQIALELQASVTQLAWISNAYMLGLTLIIPLSVWLAEQLGERRLIIGSLGLFSVFSLLVAQSGSIDTLIGWRLLQEQLCQRPTTNRELLLIRSLRGRAGTDDLHFVAGQIDSDLLSAERPFGVGHRGRRSVHVDHPAADEVRCLVPCSLS